MKTNTHTSPARRLLVPLIPLAIGAAWASTAGASVGPVINEFSASTSGTDVEYVEILGGASTDYSDHFVLAIEGDVGEGVNAGVIDAVISLGTTDALGIYLASLPASALENGTLTLLLVQDNTGVLGSDLDANNDGVLDVTPWTAVTDAVSVHDGGAGDLTYGAPVLGPNFDGISPFTPGGASRIPDGTDTGAATDWVRNDFDLAGIPGFVGTITVGEAYNTPGAPNRVYSDPVGDCGDSYTPIPDIQGSGANAATTGEVATEGIVIGDFEGSAAASGFYLQDPTGDGNPQTSDGIFVFTGGANLVSAGDRIRVFGYARERFGQTTINGADSNTAAVPSTNIKYCDAGSVTPTGLMLPFYAAASPEAYEGMLVGLTQPLVIAEYFNFDRFGEIVLALPAPGETRHFQPTALEEPGAAANGLAVANSLARITLDDAQSAQNPSTLRHPDGSAFSLTHRFRGGDTLQGVVGVLGYDFNLYRIYPTAPATYVETNPRPANPDPVNGTLRVATMNTLNYFVTPDYPSGPPDNKCGPLQNVECRGADADQPDELNRQRTKLVATLAGMGADIIGLTELENTLGVDALLDATYGLVPGLNEHLGSATYAAIDTGIIGSDAIRVGLIYKPGIVTPAGDFGILDSTVDPRFNDTLNRPSLAQTFVVNATGARFTVAMNHLKSKGSACTGDPDTGDGQGNCNVTRVTAAQALVDWLASDPTDSGDPDFLIMGDLNAYAMEDPIDAIRAGADDNAGTASDNFTDLIATYQGAYAYSFVFDGQAGYIDHLLASASLTAQATGSTIWHVNADEPDVFDYDTTFKPAAQDALYEANAYRSSDHDPGVAGLQLCDDEDPTLSVTLTPDVLFPPNHKYARVRATVTPLDNLDPTPEVTLLSITSNEPDDALGKSDGTTINDIVIEGPTLFRLRAERDELGTGRIYTITYRVTDDCGNAATKAATVTVPLIK